MSKWLAVDKDGFESVFLSGIKPIRRTTCWITAMNDMSTCPDDYYLLVPGTIEKVLGIKMTWEDDAIEYNGDYEFFSIF